jgi:predicted ATP-binding protein involved in virulence
MTKPFIARIKIKGLHYYRDFDFTFNSSINVLVGENGLGKTTVLNILFAVIRRHWTFLLNIGFDYIEIHFLNGQTISFSHSELEAFLILRYFRERSRKDDVDVIVQIKSIESIAKSVMEKFKTLDLAIQDSVKNPVLYLPAIRNIRDSLQLIGLTLDSSAITRDYVAEAGDEFNTIENEILIPLENGYLDAPISNRIRAKDVDNFLILCNQYLQNITLSVRDGRIIPTNHKSGEVISFEQLSSGERQIIYIFFNVYLMHESDIIILFDEPELSLSLTWQRRILLDIVNSGKCNFLFAITHSPFVFDNELGKYAQGINMFFTDYGFTKRND